MKFTYGKLKSVYLIWLSINFIFFLTSGNFMNMNLSRYLFLYNEDFYPFDGFYHKTYDITEFIIYSILPISIYFIVKLWRKKE